MWLLLQMGQTIIRADEMEMGEGEVCQPTAHSPSPVPTCSGAEFDAGAGGGPGAPHDSCRGPHTGGPCDAMPWLLRSDRFVCARVLMAVPPGCGAGRDRGRTHAHHNHAHTILFHFFSSFLSIYFLCVDHDEFEEAKDGMPHQLHELI